MLVSQVIEELFSRLCLVSRSIPVSAEMRDRFFQIAAKYEVDVADAELPAAPVRAPRDAPVRYVPMASAALRAELLADPLLAAWFADYVLEEARIAEWFRAARGNRGSGNETG